MHSPAFGEVMPAFRLLILPLVILILTACVPVTPAAPAATSPPVATSTFAIPPAMQTAAVKATELAMVTLDPNLFRKPTLPPPATPSADWKLVWSEEFDGPDGSPVDSSTWAFDVGGHGWGNNELEYYTDRLENAHLEGGSLVIAAREEEYEGSRYTSARLVTRDKVAWTYGRYEIRAKLPKGQGIWPAIWMLPTGNKYGGWPTGGEIDIMEFLGHDPLTVHGTLHWGNPKDASGTSISLPASPDFSEDYHVFALEWDPAEFRWFVDGVHYHTVTNWMTSADNAPFPAPFDQPFHLLLNVAVGGNWPGRPDETTTFPARMLVDYVRVYQK
jgi:beta-glucanase (GH16 family)